MKTRKEYEKTLKGIQDMVSSIRTINESIRFADDFNEDLDGMAPEDMEAPTSPDGKDFAEGGQKLGNMEPDEPDPEEGLRELGEVDQIREIALRGMIKLCKNPEDDRYQALKKIFQFCDKAAENKDNKEQQD